MTEDTHYESAESWCPEPFDAQGRLEACAALLPTTVTTLLDVGSRRVDSSDGWSITDAGIGL